MLKGALDKYKIYLFISNAIEDFRLNQYRNFQLILLMRLFCEQHHLQSVP